MPLLLIEALKNVAIVSKKLLNIFIGLIFDGVGKISTRIAVNTRAGQLTGRVNFEDK